MRLDGVGEIRIAGGNEYAMRVWLDIEKMTHVDLTAGDIVERRFVVKMCRSLRA